MGNIRLFYIDSNLLIEVSFKAQFAVLLTYADISEFA